MVKATFTPGPPERSVMLFSLLPTHTSLMFAYFKINLLLTYTPHQLPWCFKGSNRASYYKGDRKGKKKSPQVYWLPPTTAWNSIPEMSFWNTDAVKEHLRKKKGRWEPPERQEKTLQGLVSITPYQRPYTREQRQAPRCQSANGRGVNNFTGPLKAEK